ncbi:glycosyltransferase [Pseudomonas mediterranea]
MDKGTIIYIGGFELPDKNAAAHRVLANGKIFRELGYNVIYIGVHNAGASGEGLKREDFSGFECWSLSYPKNSFSWLRYIIGSSDILRFIERQQQLTRVVGVICYNYPAIAQLRIRNMCSSISAKIIADATEWYDSSSGSYFYRVVKYLDTSLRMRWVHKAADGVITTSRYLTNFYSAGGQLTVELPTLFDAEKFKAPSVRNDSKSKKFIYVGSPFDAGRVNKQRTNLKERLDVCIEVFFHLYEAGEDFSFDIYGITANDYLKVFPEHANILLEMEGRTSFKGRQPNEIILSHIAESDFSIFFRDKTRVTLAGFPSKLAESISCGTPVISNTMVSLLSYEDVDGLFLTSRGEELALVKKLMRLTPNEINIIKQAAYSSRAFDYRNYAPQVARFFDEVKI